jgi:hypothetical protein
MSAILPDSTVSGGFWEERNAKAKVKVKAKVNRTAKFHAEWSVSKSPTFFLERGGEVRRGMREKHCAEQRHLVFASCLFFAGANLGMAGQF